MGDLARPKAGQVSGQAAAAAAAHNMVTPADVEASLFASFAAFQVFLKDSVPKIVANLGKDATSEDPAIRLAAYPHALRLATVVSNLFLYHRQQKTIESLLHGLDGASISLLVKLVESVKKNGAVIDAVTAKPA